MLNERAHLAVLFATQEARRAGAREVTTLHLLAGLLLEDEGSAADLLAYHGVRLQAVRDALDLEDRPEIAEDPPRADTLQRTLERAEQEARWLECDHGSTEHLLLGLLHEDDGAAVRMLLDAGMSESAVREGLVRRAERGRRGRW